MNNKNQMSKKNIEEVIDSIYKNIMRLNYEAPYCNKSTQGQILYAIQKLSNANKELLSLI
jgi:hypothetical protein